MSAVTFLLREQYLPIQPLLASLYPLSTDWTAWHLGLIQLTLF